MDTLIDIAVGSLVFGAFLWAMRPVPGETCEVCQFAQEECMCKLFLELETPAFMRKDGKA